MQRNPQLCDFSLIFFLKAQCPPIGLLDVVNLFGAAAPTIKILVSINELSFVLTKSLMRLNHALKMTFLLDQSSGGVITSLTCHQKCESLVTYKVALKLRIYWFSIWKSLMLLYYDTNNWDFHKVWQRNLMYTRPQTCQRNTIYSRAISR